MQTNKNSNVYDINKYREKESEIPEVYKSDFGWGFYGCESDCYPDEISAIKAAKESVDL